LGSEETESEFAKDRFVIVFPCPFFLEVREPGLDIFSLSIIEFFEALNDLFIISQCV